MTTTIEVSDDAPADISTSYTLESNQEIQGMLHRSDDPTVTVNLAALSEDGKELAKKAFESWTNIAGMEFDYIESENADITFKEDIAVPSPAGIMGSGQLSINLGDLFSG